MAQELLPKDIYLSRETHDLILSFAIEFIHMLTYQANQICQKQNKNVFLGWQHVVKACEELGFQEYVGEIEAVVMEHEQQLKATQKVSL